VEWQADVAHPVLTMHVVSALQIPHQWAIGADMHGHRGSDEVSCVQRILSCLFDRAVTRNGGDADDIDIRVLQSHEQGDGIVGRGIGVDEEFPLRHATNLGDQGVSVGSYDHYVSWIPCVTYVTGTQSDCRKIEHAIALKPLTLLRRRLSGVPSSASFVLLS